MAVELDTLEIRIEASANGAASALDKLTASLKNVKKAMTGMSGKEKPVEDMKKSAEQTETAVKKAEGAVSGAEKATEKLTQTQNKAAGSGKKFSMSLADITKATGKVQSGISGIFNGLKTGNASSLLGGFSSLKSVFSEMKIGGGDGGSGTTAAADGATRAGEAFAKMSGEAGKAGDAAGEAGEIAGASAGGWQAVALVVGVKVVKALVKAFVAFQKLKASIIIAPFKALADHAGRAAGKVGQLFSSLKRIATYRLLRTALKEIGEGFSTGLENAYYFSQVTGGLLAKSLDSISTEMLYLKNSVGAAVAPLINALAPAVEFVVDKFVGLVNVVNQFLSALGVTGKWIKAIKYPTKYGDALDDATGSAKELKRTILGIDEINPLDGDNGSGKGKSGLTASDYSSMFEYATVNPQISDFAAKIKEMVENGKWTEVGQTLAAKINNLIKIADEKIKWENVGGKITKWLTNITDAFNGFVREFDGTGLGNLVGDAIMTAVNTIDTAVNLTDFEALGDKITDFINGGLETIDGQKIGKTIHDTVKKVLDLAKQVLNGIDKGALSEDVSGFFTGLDLADLIASFRETFGALGNLIETIAPDVMKGVGGALFTALKEDIKAAFDPNTDSPWWIDMITSLSPAAVSAKLVLKIADAVTDAINWVKENVDFEEMWTNIKTGLSTAWENTKSFFTTIGENVGEFVSDVKLKIAGMWSNVTSGFSSAWATVKGWYEGKKTEVGNFASDVKLKIAGMWSNVTSGFSSAWATVKGWYEGKKTEVGNFVSDVKLKITGMWSNVTSGFSSAWSTVSGWYETKKKDVETFVAGVKGKLSGMWSAITSGFSSAWSTVSGWYETKKKDVETFVAGVKGKLPGMWDNIKSGFATAWNNLIDTLTGILNKNPLTSWLADLIEGAKFKESFEQAGKDSTSKYEYGLNSIKEVGTKYGKTVKDNIYNGAAVNNSAKTLGSNYSSALDYLAATHAGGNRYGSKISSNVLTGGDPDQTAKDYRTTFMGTFDGATDAGLPLGRALKANIKDGADGTGTADGIRSSIFSEIDKDTGGKGYTLGTYLGQNIATGIKAGIKSKTLSIDYNISVNGGAPSKLPVKLTPLPYAEGGIVDAGQMFIAQEAGPELIGNIGRKTAVANTTQMVDAMAQGVYQANAESNMLLRQIIDYAAEIAAKEYESGGSVTVESITQAMTRNNRRLGKTVVAVG